MSNIGPHMYEYLSTPLGTSSFEETCHQQVKKLESKKHTLPSFTKLRKIKSTRGWVTFSFNICIIIDSMAWHTLC